MTGRGVVLVGAQGERNGPRLDEQQVAVFELDDDGAIARATFVYEDPDEYNAFWAD